jgi:hypothetical protein
MGRRLHIALPLNTGSAFGLQKGIGDKQVIGAALFILIINAVRNALHPVGRVLQKLSAHFQFFKGLLERSSRSFHLSYTFARFIDADYSGVAVIVKIMLTIGRCAFQMIHLSPLLFC